MSKFVEGRAAGITEALCVLSDMEIRYRKWANANPGIEGIPDSARGKIEAISTARRAIEKLKLQTVEEPT